MGQMRVIESPISGLYVIEPTVHRDARGEFLEVYNSRDLSEFGIDCNFVQENQNVSLKGVLRGLHFQKRYPQAKLARVIEGCVFDVAVDLREGSKTFGQWYGTELSAGNHRMLYIPAGFAHGMLTLTERATFAYMCSEFYHPGDEGGIAWNDPSIGIVWPGVNGDYPGCADASSYTFYDGAGLSLSEKDQHWPTFSILNKETAPKS